MPEKTIRFNIDESIKVEAEICKLWELFNSAMDKLEREIRAVPSWWEGDSLIPFMRLAEEILADRQKIADIIISYADKIAVARNEMLEGERVGKGMFDADPGILHATVPILACNRENIDIDDADATLADLDNMFKHWNTLLDWIETGRGEYLDIRQARLQEVLDSLISETRDSPAGVGPITVIRYDWDTIRDFMSMDPREMTEFDFLVLGRYI